QKLFDAWQEQETNHVLVRRAEDVCMPLREMFETKKHDVAQCHQVYEAVMIPLEQERTDIVHALPVEWVHEYMRMAQRIERPLVLSADRQCSGCFYSVLAHDVVTLHQGQLVRCKQCFRYLIEGIRSECQKTGGDQQTT